MKNNKKRTRKAKRIYLKKAYQIEQRQQELFRIMNGLPEDADVRVAYKQFIDNIERYLEQQQKNAML